MYSVYIILCADNTLYTGMTNNVTERYAKHQAGTAARYTRAKGVKALLYVEECGTRSKALKREAAIKRLKTADKWQLITNQYIAVWR